MSSVAERTPADPSATRGSRRGATLVQGVAIAVGFVMLVVGFAVLAVEYRPYRVPSNSMTPTIAIGDMVLARKADGNEIGRGDIVVFRDPAWGNATMVKRVVAVGGDTVLGGDDRKLTVNGKVIDEPYIDVQGRTGNAFSVTVPTGRLFLLGDYRGNSLDSRSHLELDAGTVPASDVVARVEATLLPLSRSSVHERVTAFDVLGAPAAHGPGPLRPAAYAAVAGAVLVLAAALAGGLVSAARWARRRRRS